MHYLTRPEKCDKFSRTYSQGGAKTPTGGIPVCTGKPANAPFDRDMEVSRSGEKPEPTVTVRMKEDNAVCNRF
jgi:hypothetical protein